MLVALISLGSSVAFNAIISLQLLALVFTNLLPIACLIYRRPLGAPLPRRSWSLDRLGMPINVIACIYLIYLVVFTALPTQVPVKSLETGNWAPATFVGVILLALVYYLLHGRSVFDGPVKYFGSIYAWLYWRVHVCIQESLTRIPLPLRHPHLSIEIWLLLRFH